MTDATRATPASHSDLSARELLAEYYEHPLVASPTMAAEIRSEGWRAGASGAEQAFLEILERALSQKPALALDGEETWESINQWCDDTFGPATVPQIIARAKEEFVELETEGADPAIEAADVVICLCRVPGFAEALQRKMAVNRKRKWRLTGNGTGYHIPDATSPAPANPSEGEE